jgi:hypothetical protein
MPPGLRRDWLAGKSEAQVVAALADAERFLAMFGQVSPMRASYRRAARLEAQRAQEARAWLAQRQQRQP